MDTSSPALVTLQSQISTLTDLHSKIQSLRTIPPLLLRPPPAPLVPPLQEIKDFAQTLKSDGVQEALRAAGESEKGDWKGVGVGGRREIRKRRCVLVDLDLVYFDVDEDEIDDRHLHSRLNHIALYLMTTKCTPVAPCCQLTHRASQSQSSLFQPTSANLTKPIHQHLNSISISGILCLENLTMRWRPKTTTSRRCCQTRWSSDTIS